ncbi:hypothetical protein [Wenjunlia vitaminophila]|uniref:hypothetical protein n=1 Tax=Wenjunlia vitaminophila TaxID=76728 RepID=UPI0003629CEF|nr:hypothetical protein [Wenjunlia vitaminophila]
MSGPVPLPAPWASPGGALAVPVAAGVHWDAVRVSDRALGAAVLVYLGRRTGAVIQDGRTGVRYWLVPPRAADPWPALPAVSVLGCGAFVAVPPPRRTTGPGPHWHVPPAPDRHLTPPELLGEALDTAVRHSRHLAPVGPPGLAAVERNRRDQALLARLRDVNRRSRSPRPWG